MDRRVDFSPAASGPALRGLWLLLVVLCIGVVASPTAAQANARYAGFVMEASTGEIFYAEDADAYLYPASLTKMMTLYMLFQAVERGEISLNDGFYVSANANAAPPSRIDLTTGGTIRVEDAIYALVTKSANNVAVVVAENLAGTEPEFARHMTLQAQRLGMTRTTFRNASGLPNAGQRSTARDMARLAQALLRDFPQYYHYFSTESWTYRGVTYGNHNRLLGSYAGMDGLKTGYIRASGYNLVASAVRGELRLIGVVFGGRTASSRNEHMADLLDRAFESERGQYLIVHGTRPFAPPVPIARPVLPAPTPPLAVATAPTVATLPAPPPQPEMDDLRPLVAAALAPASGDPLQLVPTAVTSAGSAPIPVAAPIPSTDYGLSPAAQEAASILGLTTPSGTAAVGAAAAAAVGTAPVAAQPVAALPTLPEPISIASLAAASAPVPVPQPVTPGSVTVLSEAPGAAAPGAPPAALQVPGDWGIQVGAFPTPSGSQEALMNAARSAPQLLRGLTPRIVAVDTEQGQLYRARLFGLDQASAALACQALVERGQDCFAVAPGS